ncbi:MAG: VWA domain-containing protein [Hyphomicrobiales bacterium]|nr:VWA domain-containing protein [Hyphomicrobiales bacterium]
MNIPSFSFTLKFLVVSALLATASAPATAKRYINERIEVAFVIDTTGSMATLIEGAKRKIWSIANTIVDINPNADIRMALVAYRDYGDKYVVKTFDMSADIQGLYGNLIGFQAVGGGDTPEAVNEALNASIHDVNWSRDQKTHRMVFLVGDAPPHMDYDNGPKYPEVIRFARTAGITIHAVQAGNSKQTRNVWKDIAYRGAGDYISIPQDGGQITIIETPYDDDIITLQRRIDKTVVPYGSKKTKTGLLNKLKGKLLAAPSVTIENSKFYSKRSVRKEVVTGSGDIISAIRNKDIELDAIKRDELPKQLQSMNKTEQKKYINEKISERSALEEEMARLVKKHDAYTVKEKEKLAKTKPADSFDKAVSRAITKSF